MKSSHRGGRGEEGSGRGREGGKKLTGKLFSAERMLNSSLLKRSNNEQSGELKLEAPHKWAHERGER